MMKAIQPGLWLAAGLLVLLWVALSVPAQAQTIPQSGGPEGTPAIPTITPSPAQVGINQQLDLVLTTTVGSSPTTCGITRTIQVRRDTMVYPCYAVENRSPVSLTLHQIASRRQGVITDSLALTLAPGAVTNTLALGLVLTDATSFDVTDLVTWTARAVTPTQLITRTDSIVIDVITPTLSVVKTVGIDRTVCPATQTLRVPTGSTVYYCLRVENQGDEAFTRHELVDAPLGLAASLVYTVQPGTTWVITPGVLAELGVGGALQRANVTAPFTNSVTLTSTTASGLSAHSASTATIGVGTTTVVFTKTVGTEPDVCSGTGTLNLPLGTPLYYCVSILNTGAVTLTSHTLSEPNLAIDITFDYTLTPGSLLTITNRVLTETLGQMALFGPFEYSGAYPAVVNNTMSYSGTSTEGSNVASSSATLVNPPPTPVPTSTPAPRPPSTNTPFPTSTPGPTNTPEPPTPTLTPTFTPETPTATPTRSYAVSSLATPTPTPLNAAAAQATSDAGFAATATAQALTGPVSPLVPGFAMTELPETLDEQAVEEGAAESAPILPGELGEQPLVPPTAEVMGVPLGTPLPASTPTPAIVVIVVTDTPGAPGELLNPLRPVAPPTPTPTPDYLLAAATALDAMVAAAGWIWFLTGSLIFFITAGIVAGFFWRGQEMERFELEPVADEAYWLPDDDLTTAKGDLGTAADTDLDQDDEWPANLP